MSVGAVVDLKTAPPEVMSQWSHYSLQTDTVWLEGISWQAAPMAVLLDTNPASGGPGIEPRWTRSDKDGVGTAYSALSRVWFPAGGGTTMTAMGSGRTAGPTRAGDMGTLGQC